MFYSSGRWNGTFYYFNSYTGKNWLTHDPCGRNRLNQKKNVLDPNGNIFIRAELVNLSAQNHYITLKKCGENHLENLEGLILIEL